MKEHPGSQGTFWIDNEMLADVLKPWTAFRDLSDTVSRGTAMFCSFGESIEPPASTVFGR
jgi:hypothetical protein